MAKYDPLYEHLLQRSNTTWSASFSEVERILGETLPKSARKHRAWWANEGGGNHVQAHAWVGAGWQVAEVDLGTGIVRFERAR